MDNRRIGSQGLTTSALGLGCMEFAGAYGAADPDESIATIRHAADLGVTIFDTADVYGPFTGEQIVGKALRSRRDEVFVSTKFGGAEMADDGSVLGGATGSPDYVRKSAERSLRNLGTDYIDLFIQHRVGRDVPIEDTFGALRELVDAGKVRYVGMSEASGESIRKAHAVTPLSAVETEYSLFSRQVESNGVLETTRELGIGFLAYAPLGRGFLTGAITSPDQIADTDLRAGFPRFQAGNLEENLAPLTRLQAVAMANGTTMGQLALAWLLSRNDDVVPLPGTRRRKHLEENVQAADVRFNAATMAEIESLVEATAIAGDRRSPADADIQEPGQSARQAAEESRG